MFILNTLSSAGLNVWFASLFGGNGGGGREGGVRVDLLCIVFGGFFGIIRKSF